MIPGEFGPFAVVSVLWMLDIEPVRDVFSKFGLDFKQIPGSDEYGYWEERVIID